jgi:hypothetical protein
MEKVKKFGAAKEAVDKMKGTASNVEGMTRAIGCLMEEVKMLRANAMGDVGHLTTSLAEMGEE